MQTYIVFDLEWNQSAVGKTGTIPGLPFEIIEIGAVKLDEKLRKTGEFHRVIRPVVYRQLHFRVVEVVNVTMEELQRGGSGFVDACTDFLKWCFAEGESPVFCTWGEMDLTQLEKNMSYHHMKSRFKFPLLYYDVQKLYAIESTGVHKTVEPLDHAVDELNINSGENFHRALADAQYTARVLQEMDFDAVRGFLSVDYYNLPENRSEEIYLQFPGYTKFISRAFPGKEECFSEKNVTDMVCPVCHRVIRKRIRWFTANQRQYHAVAFCPQHGYVKGKLRVKKDGEDKVFAVKTIKLIDDAKAEAVAVKMEDVKRAKAEKRHRINH